MAEISNNLIAVLLVVAILISGLSAVTVANMGRWAVTGGVPLEYGTANVSITGAVLIDMLRNVTDFDSGTLDGQWRVIDTLGTSNNPGGFDDGTEGNGSGDSADECSSNYDAEGYCAFPFVVLNEGNVNVSINISADDEARDWISGGAYQQVAYRDNASGACSADLGEFVLSAWTDLNTTETVLCSDLNFTNSDTLRIHFKLGIPSDTEVGTGYGTIINIGAVDSS